MIAFAVWTALALFAMKAHLVTADANGREHTSDVDFVVVWKRQPNGSLRIAIGLLLMHAMISRSILRGVVPATLPIILAPPYSTR